MAANKTRRAILIVACVYGIGSLFGAGLFAVAGAGIYGSPLAGGDDFYKLTLRLLLLFGPVAILPCTIIEAWKPAWGAIALCVLTFVVVIFSVLLNSGGRWVATHDAALASLCLAAPMFALGSLLIWSNSAAPRGVYWVWWLLAGVLAIPTIYFLWLFGRDGVEGAVHWLRLGAI